MATRTEKKEADLSENFSFYQQAWGAAPRALVDHGHLAGLPRGDTHDEADHVALLHSPKLLEVLVGSASVF